MSDYNKKIIVCITGASGAIYGIILLQILAELKIESHLVISQSAKLTIPSETNFSLDQVIKLANYYYNLADIGARIASGSFSTDGMIVAPCSMKTLSLIAHGFENNLITRAAGVIIKEQKKLVLMARETPLSSIHLSNMLKLSKMGIIISPPVPAFYNHPLSINDLVVHSVSRVLDLFAINTNLIKRWQGLSNQ